MTRLWTMDDSCVRLLSYAPCVHKSYIIDNTVIRKFSTPNFSVVVWMRYHEIWYSLKYITISTWKSTVFHKISKINLTTLKILILGRYHHFLFFGSIDNYIHFLSKSFSRHYPLNTHCTTCTEHFLHYSDLNGQAIKKSEWFIYILKIRNAN